MRDLSRARVVREGLQEEVGLKAQKRIGENLGAWSFKGEVFQETGCAGFRE